MFQVKGVNITFIKLIFSVI